VSAAIETDATTTVSRARPPRRKIDLTNAAMTVWAVLVYVFLFLPIVMIVAFSFNKGRALLAWEGFGVDWYRSLPHNQVILDTITTSLKAAVGAAIIATVLGSLAGIALARRPGTWTILFMALIFLVLVTPEIVDAISLLIWYVRIKGPFAPVAGGGTDFLHPVNYGLLRLWVGHALFATAVVTLIVRARLSGLDESLEEAAADLYASPWRAFRQITLPLMLPAVLAGALLAFSLSLDNTIISTFVHGAGATPWPVYVFSAVRSILRPEIAAASTLLLLLTLLALGLVAFVLKRSGDSAEEVARTFAAGG
jgi:ABC-type spermidine/putrescine transport system permease subunit II